MPWKEPYAMDQRVRFIGDWLTGVQPEQAGYLELRNDGSPFPGGAGRCSRRRCYHSQYQAERMSRPT